MRQRRNPRADSEDPDALTPEEIDGHYCGGDFTKNWWVVDEKHRADSERIFGDAWPAMIEALARVFPKDRCRAALESRSEVLVLYLFDIFPMTGRLLAMAFDIVTIGVEVVERVDPHLLRRLSTMAEFEGAELEVAVWANAVRAGMGVARVAGSSKRPDLLLAVPVLIVHPGEGPEVAGRQERRELLVQLEVKSVATCQASRVPFQVSIWDASSGDLPPADRCVVVRRRDGTRFPVATVANRDRVKSGAPALSRAIHLTLASLERTSWPLGCHELLPVEGGEDLVAEVVIDVLDPAHGFLPECSLGGGSLSADLFEDADDAHVARKVVDKVRDALAQLEIVGEKIASVVFLDLPIEVDLELAFKLVEEAFQRDPEKHRFLDGVLVRRRGRYPNGKEVWCGGPIPGPGRRLDGRMLQALWNTLTDSPHRLMGPWTDDEDGGAAPGE